MSTRHSGSFSFWCVLALAIVLVAGFPGLLSAQTARSKAPGSFAWQDRVSGLVRASGDGLQVIARTGSVGLDLFSTYRVNESDKAESKQELNPALGSSIERSGLAFTVTFPGAQASEPRPIRKHAHPLFLHKAGRSEHIDLYESIEYANAWEGVSLQWSTVDPSYPLRIDAASGKDLRQVRLAVPGASLRKVKSDSLVLLIGGEELCFGQPTAFREQANVLQPVPVSYIVHDNGEIGFDLPEPDFSARVTVAPVVYSRRMGGASRDIARSVYIDSNRNSYVCGETEGPDFQPSAPGGYRRNSQDRDCFVIKLDSTGVPIYLSVFGGASSDDPYAIAVDSVGSAIVTGQTRSQDFPTTTGAFRSQLQDVQVQGDCFVSKLSPTGANLLYSTYIGGALVDVGYSVAVDRAGDIYVCGSTSTLQSSAVPFPTTNKPLQSRVVGGNDCFAFRMRPAGQGQADLVSSTIFGSFFEDVARSVAIDRQGSVYVAGSTSWLPVGPPQFRFPTTANSLKGPDSTIDAFFVKLRMDADSVTLLYSTLYGSSTSSDVATGIIVDVTGMAFVAGYSDGADFPATTDSTYQTRYGGGASDGFLLAMRMEPTPGPGTVPQFVTLLGGNGSDQPSALAIDACGALYLTGATTSTNYPVSPDAQDSTYGGNGNTDAFLSKISSDGKRLNYSSYIGGNGPDFGNGLYVDRSGAVTVVGQTNSMDFQSTDPRRGLSDAFATSIQVGILPLRPAITARGATSFCQGDSVVLDAANSAYIQYQWFFNGVRLEGQNRAQITALDSGRYTVYVRDVSGCDGTSPIDVTVFPLPFVGIPDTVVLCQGQSQRIVPVIRDSIVQYNWFPNGQLSSGDSAQVTLSNVTRSETIVLTVVDAKGCRSTDTMRVFVVDPNLLVAQLERDTIALCPADTIEAELQVINTAPIRQSFRLRSQDPGLLVPSDTFVARSGDTTRIMVRVAGLNQPIGPQSRRFALVDQCDAEQPLLLIANIGLPSYTFLPTQDSLSVCIRQTLTREISVRNSSIVPVNVNIRSTNPAFVLDTNRVFLDASASAQVRYSISSDTAGVFRTRLLFEDACGGLDSVLVQVTVVGTPLRLTLEPISQGPIQTGSLARLGVTVDSMQVLDRSSDRALTVAMRYNRASLEPRTPVSTNCQVTPVIQGDSIVLVLTNCRQGMQNPLAEVQFETLVGQTLRPTVVITRVAASDQCIAAGSVEADTLELLPFGCEISVLQSTAAASFLSAPWPSPALGTISLRYASVEAVDVRIEIYDQLGALRRTLVHGQHRPGEYQANADVSDLGSGTYHIVMSAGQYRGTKTLVVTQ